VLTELTKTLESNQLTQLSTAITLIDSLPQNFIALRLTATELIIETIPLLVATTPTQEVTGVF
jgi:hypothetical protein